jgi:hypothetical protein
MEPSGKFSVTTWLIITIASIGFLFDTYELLMTPLVAPPAIAELLDLPAGHHCGLADCCGSRRSAVEFSACSADG